MALIVIHAHDDVVPAAAQLGEDRIRGEGAAGVDPFGAGGFDGRGDFLDFLIAEQAVFPAVGVQARHRDPGVFDP